MMKTYVRVFGPPLGDALDALQGIAAEIPKVSHYHMLSGYEGAPPYPISQIPTVEIGTSLREPRIQPPPTPTPANLPSEGLPATKATHPAISKSGYTLGEYDFFFEWSETPSWQQMHDLIAKIDKAFTKLGCKYTLTTK